MSNHIWPEYVGFSTPIIPEEIRAIRHPAYKNIFEYELGNENLWGTETLFGDWAGHTLIVAKDFYPASYIEEAMQAGIADPYCHGVKVRTNIRLVQTLSELGCLSPAATNLDCGFLYASACFLLRADGITSGALPDELEALELSEPVLLFTIDNMPNLKNIVMMANEASKVFEFPDLNAATSSRGLSCRRALNTSRHSNTELLDSWSYAMAGMDE
jgi:hypothetical protein